MKRTTKGLLALGIVLVLLAAGSPWLIRAYWSAKSTNPVRRGFQRATELGCFSCHGELGRGGVADPGGVDREVPSWDGGTWMMYVENDEQIREIILEGSTPRQTMQGGAEIAMPAYAAVLGGTDVEDLVASFKALSGMQLPESGTPARRGYDVMRKWNCDACHAPAGSGGLPNPGSFTGFIPGWYGADFEELVQDRQEFDRWIREGSTPRLSEHPIAGFFMRRQRISMPAYRNLDRSELDDLWAYSRWLAETNGEAD